MRCIVLILYNIISNGEISLEICLKIETEFSKNK